jgi:hypothetical protein
LDDGLAVLAELAPLGDGLDIVEAGGGHARLGRLHSSRVGR